MPVLVAENIHKAYGPNTILENVAFSIHSGERVGLVGINGAGKSTLARILGGLEQADSGTVARRRGASIEYLTQAPSFEGDPTAREAVLSGLREWAAAKAQHDAASAGLSAGDGDIDALLHQQSEAAAAVERLGGWDVDHEIDSLLGHLNIARPDGHVASMSGGERRRVALARLLVARPALAVLDEPTNHLDVETIEWLEEYLVESFTGAMLLITHDRYLLDRVVDRTVELDRGVVYSYDGGYGDYLEAKAVRQAQAARTESNRQNFLRSEIEWLRRQPKARSTKQKARIERAEAAIDAPKLREDKQATFAIESARTGKTILELKRATLGVGGRELVHALDFILTKGERVGIVGRNGTGKTTLLRAIVGDLEPMSGEVVRGLNTRIAYFDQERSGLDDAASVFENVVGDQPKIVLGGEPIEPRSYLERFAFDPQKQRQPVGSLSGGERARVALAKLLRQPANVVLLDEPTNDLDLATLGALESMLVELDGTALVVTHDRYFLDRVATAVLAFEGDGRVVLYAGNYTMYRRLRDATKKAASASPSEAPKAKAQASKPPPAAPAAPTAPAALTPLTSSERTELDGLLDVVERAETRVVEIETKLGNLGSYGGNEVRTLIASLESAKADVVRLTARWEALEARRDVAKKKR